MTRYGAYKTPGGKLIAVEFDVEDGVLRHVVVSGDFFLYPEEALGSLAGALEGMSASASEQEFAERVETARVSVGLDIDLAKPDVERHEPDVVPAETHPEQTLAPVPRMPVQKMVNAAAPGASDDLLRRDVDRQAVERPVEIRGHAHV